MTPAFDSVTAFIAMGGYGPYVWTCYGVFFLLLGLVVVVSVRQRRQLKQRQRRQWRNTPRESTRSHSGFRPDSEISDHGPAFSPLNHTRQ